MRRSDGPQPHLVNIQFHKKTRVQEIEIYTDYKLDESYTPANISVRAGTTFHDIQEVHSMELDEPSGWVKIPIAPTDPEPGRPRCAHAPAPHPRPPLADPCIDHLRCATGDTCGPTLCSWRYCLVTRMGGTRTYAKSGCTAQQSALAIARAHCTGAIHLTLPLRTQPRAPIGATAELSHRRVHSV